MANAVQRICFLLQRNRTPQEFRKRGEKKSEAREDEGKLGLNEKNERAGDVEMWRHGDRIRRKLE